MIGANQDKLKPYRAAQGARMNVESVSRILKITVAILALTSCGGGGGGGGGSSLLSGGDSSSGDTAGSQDADNNLTIESIDVGSDGVLDGNEKRSVIVTVLEEGTGQDGISVTFSISGGSGTLSPTSATTREGGLAEIQLIGGGEAGTVEITASAELNNGTSVQDVQSVQTSAVKPTITLTVRDQSGAEVIEFGANQELTLEAVVADYDGSPLDDEDAGVGHQGKSR